MSVNRTGFKPVVLAPSGFLRFWICLLVTLTCSVLSFGQNDGNGFDIETSGLNEFWRIHALLEKDTEPSEEDWNRLFATPGYALLEERERRRKVLTNAFRLAFMPSKQAEKDDIIKLGNSWTSYILPHLQNIPKRRAEMESFQKEVEKGELFTQALQRTQEFLPKGTITRFPAPPVSLFVFIDGRGYSRLLFDLLYLLNKHDRLGLIGHEFHHYYRNKIGRKYHPFGDDLLPWAIVNVENEGIAGLIDKREIPKMTIQEIEKVITDQTQLNYAKSYHEVYARSNEWLKFAEQKLERIADTPDQQAALSKELHGGLPDNGRAMGAFMSEVIIKELGRKKFLTTVGDSFAFWLVYNQAAKRTKGRAYTLSNKAVKVIVDTRSKYQISL